MPLDDSTPLSSLRANQRGTIQYVKASEMELLKYFENLGLIPDAEIEVKDYSPYDHNLTIKIGRKSAVLGLNITSKIYVKEI